MGLPKEKVEILEFVIKRGSESRDVEFKSSMNWLESNTKAKVLKAILAFGNTPGGGYLVFGVEPEDCKPVGMKINDFDSFNEDDCRNYVGNYATPYVDFSLNKLEFDNMKFVIFSVLEFDNIPVMCKKNGPEINGKLSVKTGKLYIRPLTTAYQSSEIKGDSEWIHLMSRSNQKHFIEEIKNLPCHQIEENIKPPKESAFEHYKNERKELLNE